MKRALAHLGAVFGASSLALLLALLLPQPAWAAPSALVVPEQLPLRAAPRDAAPVLTALIRGEALEIRGQQGQFGDWLQVWDHGRERGGFVRSGALLAIERDPAALLVQLRLARRQVGAEGLGLGLAAALIEQADVDWLRGPQGAELLEHLIALQERLAARANSGSASAALQAQVAARYGHPLRQLARADGSQWLCPATEPAQLLRGLPGASAAQQARAALQLTSGECAVGSLVERLTLLQDIELPALTPPLRKALLMRRAGLQASLAYAARADEAAARRHAQASLADWLRLNPAELDEDDQVMLREAAIRVAPMRWLVQEAGSLRRGKLEVVRVAGGSAGQQCLRINEQTHCSHGLLLWNSLRAGPDGQSLLLAVQPLDGWTELWRLGADGSLQVLPPAAATPGLSAIGIAEWAGSDRGQLLVAREAWVDGKALRRFEILPGTQLHAQPLRWAGEAMLLAAFQRGAAAEWKAGSPLAR